MVTEPDSALAESRRLPTVTLEGWRQFVNTRPTTLDLLDRVDYDALGDPAREDYDERRIAYHSELVIIETSTVREIIHQGRLLMLLNQREISARRSLIVDGPWASGKSTTIKLLGRIHEQRVQRRYPDQDRIPVVYITTPPKGSPRKLASEFAHFLGLPDKPRYNTSDIAAAVCQVLTQARTDLVIDEIHNLNLDSRAGEELSDHLKYFTEHLPATFVYAGIEVERSGLFTGTRGRQLAGRCGVIHTSAFPDAKEWRQLIAAMEGTLRLHRHEPGSLVAQARYLHRRTGGMIGSLAHLIRASAIQAMLDGTEHITREAMDAVLIDYAAHTAAARTAS